MSELHLPTVSRHMFVSNPSFVMWPSGEHHPLVMSITISAVLLVRSSITGAINYKTGNYCTVVAS